MKNKNSLIGLTFILTTKATAYNQLQKRLLIWNVSRFAEMTFIRYAGYKSCFINQAED